MDDERAGTAQGTGSGDGGAARGTGAPVSPGGEARPTAHRLARPPGARYRTAGAAPVVRARPRLARALAGGAAVAGVLALLLAIFQAVLWGGVGQTTILVVGAWAIGVTVRGLAWGGAPHLPSRAPVVLAAALGAAAWAASLAGAWILSLALLPNSVRTLAERIAATPFPDWVGPQLSPFRFVEALLIVAIAAFAARSAAVRDGDGAG